MEGNHPSVLELTFAKNPDAASSVEMMAPIGKKYHVRVLLGQQIQLRENKLLSSLNRSNQMKRRLELVEAATTANLHKISPLARPSFFLTGTQSAFFQPILTEQYSPSGRISNPFDG